MVFFNIINQIYNITKYLKNTLTVIPQKHLQENTRKEVNKN